MYIIRRRSNNQIVERGFKTREDAKPNRDIHNDKYYKTGVPEHNREFYVTKCPVNHPASGFELAGVYPFPPVITV